MDGSCRFLIAALASLVAFLGFDLAFVLSGQNQGPLRLSGWVAYGAVYAAFLWAGWPQYAHQRPAMRCLSCATAALAALIVWWPFAVIALLYFHHAIGGSK